ncbi:hypothetical protein G7K_5780-t1 [Saitoella complicata NRRL Y-17804]|uniref:Uncharacterized protein n=1 Tax=Saitoella complicata (strain BCRC 22490 / CBS 7301 / JCM 7358 / NBRC 10748 / NRRL Y-17804) TaxID=698492 RepID=A0A0E9NP78_SAICN|nr:hypothetical protein G7K_5780-t1 [Saitoella complicata NRRL Y-17804]
MPSVPTAKTLTERSTREDEASHDVCISKGCENRVEDTVDEDEEADEEGEGDHGSQCGSPRKHILCQSCLSFHTRRLSGCPLSPYSGQTELEA